MILRDVAENILNDANIVPLPGKIFSFNYDSEWELFIPMLCAESFAETNMFDLCGENCQNKFRKSQKFDFIWFRSLRSNQKHLRLTKKKKTCAMIAMFFKICIFLRLSIISFVDDLDEKRKKNCCSDICRFPKQYAFATMRMVYLLDRNCGVF